MIRDQNRDINIQFFLVFGEFWEGEFEGIWMYVKKKKREGERGRGREEYIYGLVSRY